MSNLYVLMAISFMIVSCACNESVMTEENIASVPMRTKYFGSFASYELPIRPVDPLSEEETKALEKDGYAFYEAKYDDSGKLQMLRKHYHGKIESQWDYTYTERGEIEKCVLTRPLDPTYAEWNNTWIQVES